MTTLKELRLELSTLAHCCTDKSCTRYECIEFNKKLKELEFETRKEYNEL